MAKVLKIWESDSPDYAHEEFLIGDAENSLAITDTGVFAILDTEGDTWYFNQWRKALLTEKEIVLEQEEVPGDAQGSDVSPDLD